MGGDRGLGGTGSRGGSHRGTYIHKTVRHAGLELRRKSLWATEISAKGKGHDSRGVMALVLTERLPRTESGNSFTKTAMVLLAEEETEAQRGQAMCPGHTVTQWWTQDVMD